MLGSYNAGRSPLFRAQKLAAAEKLNERRWTTIERVAPRVPNWRYKETLAYVAVSLPTCRAWTEEAGSKDRPSKDENGGRLPDKLKRFLGVFKHLRLWDDD